MSTLQHQAVAHGSSVRRYRRLTQQRVLWLFAVMALCVGSLLFDLRTGPSGLPLMALLHTVFEHASADPATRVIVWQIRLPYAVMALLVGASLGLSGAEMQTILNNSAGEPLHTRRIGRGCVRRVACDCAGRSDSRRCRRPGSSTANAFVFALLSAFAARLRCALARHEYRWRRAAWYRARIRLSCARLADAVHRLSRCATGPGVLDARLARTRRLAQDCGAGDRVGAGLAAVDAQRLDADRAAPRRRPRGQFRHRRQASAPLDAVSACRCCPRLRCRLWARSALSG